MKIHLRKFSNYFVILEEWTKLNLKFDEEKIVFLYSLILTTKLKDSNCIKVANVAMERIFGHLMNDINIGCYLLQRTLSFMLNGKYIKYGNIYKSVLTYKNSCYKDVVRNYRGKCAINFLERVKPSIYSIYETGRLHDFIESSIIYSQTLEPDTPLMSSVEDELIDYFSKSKESNNYQNFFERFHDSNMENNGKIVDWEDMEILCNDIRKYFISLNFYIRFMQECFVYERNEILKDYLKKNYIG